MADATEPDLERIEKAIINSKNSDKIDVKCMIDFKIVNGQPKLKYFLSDLRNSSFVGDLNVTSGKKLDFNIFKSVSGNEV